MPHSEAPAARAPVGIVGVGRIGLAMGRRLVAAGWPVVACDVRAAAVARLPEADAAATPAAVAAAAGLVLVAVVDDDQVRAVVGEAAGAAAPGAVVAVCSSVAPATVRDLAAAAAATGVDVVDAAIARGERGVEAGTALVLYGGPPATLERVRPALAAFTTDVVRVGDAGSGQVAKLAGNVLLWAAIRADLEVLRLGRALGVAPADLRAALALGGGANRALEEWGRHRLRWPGKDLALAERVAREAGVDTPLLDALGPLLDGVTVDDLRDLL